MRSTTLAVPLLVSFGTSSAKGRLARHWHCFSEDSEAVAHVSFRSTRQAGPPVAQSRFRALRREGFAPDFHRTESQNTTRVSCGPSFVNRIDLTCLGEEDLLAVLRIFLQFYGKIARVGLPSNECRFKPHENMMPPVNAITLDSVSGVFQAQIFQDTGKIALAGPDLASSD